MSVQYIIGASGSGKSHYLNNLIIEESIKNPDKNYIMLCPEQSTMQLQQEMVSLHPVHGFTNIDIIGFNRLAFKIFEERKVRLNKVLEDFGKSMLIRQAAGNMKEKLHVYSGCIDKHGFIDEAKSLMSELFSYNISADDIKELMLKLSENSQLRLKLSDMLIIYEEFEKKLSENYIVAEKLLELMCGVVEESEIIKDSVICLDGFTGFSPVQLKLIEKLMMYADKIIITVTMDLENYKRDMIREHELFRLSYETIESLNKIVKENNIVREKDILIERNDKARFCKSDELAHLEKYIFRYPYEKYEKIKTHDIKLVECKNTREEYKFIAGSIRKLVKEGLRYRDIAVVTGNLSVSSAVAGDIFDEYDIPYFMDYNRAMRNNPFIDSLCAVVEIAEQNFTYESVFSFLKTGVIDEIDSTFTESLENYVIARGLRGYSAWKKSIDKPDLQDIESARMLFMEAVEPVFKKFKDKDAVVRDYVEALYEFIEKYNFYDKITEKRENFEKAGMLSEAKSYARLYEKIIELFNKMLEIMPNEKVSIHDFLEIMKVGMNEISMGIIPPARDMVIVGDINRTRLANIKVLFFAEVNDGIVPKYADRAKIINDRDREIIESYGIMLAPTEKKNGFTEQFYLYLNMTKPAEKLIMSYSMVGTGGASMRPSYIIDRVLALFPNIKINNAEEENLYGTYESDTYLLVSGIKELMNLKDNEKKDKFLERNSDIAVLYRLYSELEDGKIPEIIRKAAEYSNKSGILSEKAKEAVKVNLINQSVSKLERYAACAYSYFLQYGLGLKEREEHSIDSRGVGNILHKALEITFSKVKREYKNKWEDLSDKERDMIAEESTRKACELEKNALFKEKGRMQYVEEQLVNISRRSVKTLQKQIVSGSMRPEYFELYFSGNTGLKNAVIDSGENKIMLSGIIDRADLFTSENDDNIYVKLTDYKSGKKEFKPEYIYEGLDLQLVVYMNILMEIVAKDYPGRNVVPAGMFYYHVDNPFVEMDNKNDTDLDEYKESDTESEEDILKSSKLKGLVNSDGIIPEILEKGILLRKTGNVIPLGYTKEGAVSKRLSSAASSEQFDALCSFASKKMKQLSENIIGGEIEKNPVKKGRSVQCEYCPYKEICRFDSVNSDNKIRKLKLKSGDKEKFWNMIKPGGEEDA